MKCGGVVREESKEVSEKVRDATFRASSLIRGRKQEREREIGI